MKKVSTVIMLLIASCVVFVTPTQAQADDCSAADPCGTWAVVDDSGVVTNTIVCQASVCGSGEFSGLKVVLQVPSNPVTHQSQGGYHHGSGTPLPETEGVVRYSDETNLFTRDSRSFPAPVVKTEKFDDGTSLTTLQTTIKSNLTLFNRVEDFVDGEGKLIPIVDDQTGAELYVYQYVHTGFWSEPTVQTITFDSPKTREEITDAVMENNLTLINNWLTPWFFDSLGDWLLPTP